MVKHDIVVKGVDISGTERKCPVVLQMRDDDFPSHYLQDLSSPGATQISKATPINSSQPLLQPVQRMLQIAQVKLNCDTLGGPRLDPTRIQSAGLVVRRVYRKGLPDGNTTDDPDILSAWMRSPSGQFQWVRLRRDQETLDPDPAQRRQLSSGQPALDRLLAASALTSAYTESTTPAFCAPPATCANLNRTVFYAVIPTASSEVSDTQPAQPPQFNSAGLAQSLPGLLQSSENSPPPVAPLPGVTIDYHWMSDDFLNALYPPSVSGTTVTPDPRIPPFQVFSTALRMLDSVFGAFSNTSEGNAILEALNQHNVTFGTAPNTTTQPMGDFYSAAKNALLVYPPPSTPNTITMPDAWDTLDDDDQTALVNAMIAALAPQSQQILSPQARFQETNPPRKYRLRLFFRVKSESPSCPPETVWSEYSDAFHIAPWYEGGRPQPPVPMPDPTKLSGKPNCFFQVPGSLMGAMQGSSMSGLMNGGGGGPALSLGWICGFNIPLITICAFFVLNIFLMLLNIVFFWLPIIKICIPIPMPSSSDEGAS